MGERFCTRAKRMLRSSLQMRFRYYVKLHQWFCTLLYLVWPQRFTCRAYFVTMFSLSWHNVIVLHMSWWSVHISCVRTTWNHPFASTVASIEIATESIIVIVCFRSITSICLPRDLGQGVGVFLVNTHQGRAQVLHASSSCLVKAAYFYATSSLRIAFVVQETLLAK